MILLRATSDIAFAELATEINTLVDGLFPPFVLLIGQLLTTLIPLKQTKCG